MDVHPFFVMMAKPKPKSMTIKTIVKLNPPERVIPKSTKYTSGKWVVYRFSPQEAYEFLVCDICDGFRGAYIQGYSCRCGF